MKIGESAMVCKTCGAGMGGPKCRSCRVWEKRVREAIKQVLADRPKEEECFDCFPENDNIGSRLEYHVPCEKHELFEELGL